MIADVPASVTRILLTTGLQINNMIRLLLLKCCLLFTLTIMAKTIVVKNIEELNSASKEANPGDFIILQNGEWKNVTISLSCAGTGEKPITFKAQTQGKVLITGHSKLELGGSFIVVDGLLFTNGYAGDDAVIDFRINKDRLANNCRVTDCAVVDFNNPRRMDENNWVLFYGKNNRLDHCSFLDKKNMGVLLAVVLDDERSRENFHSIDHNYFGLRQPLASNGGEIIRVGLAQHCQFNSNTQMTDNFFEHCDGEAEVISIKSGSNLVRNNLFKECQGSVVLRHGNNNTIENNIFLGNDKDGTGGVRVINKAQWVVNNLFYKCRGTGFRSPLTVMNGIPNSPPTRYVQVTDAVIANNTFYNCSFISLCDGSDTERTLPPRNVYLLNNTFYNTRDDIIYKAYDDISGFLFASNKVNNELKQNTTNGFEKTSFTTQKSDDITLPYPIPGVTQLPTDSLQRAAQQRLHHSLPGKAGFSDPPLLKKILGNAYSACGAKWFTGSGMTKSSAPLPVNCNNAAEVYKQLERKESLIITLTAKEYTLDKPLAISKNVQFTGDKKTTISFNTGNILSAFIIKGNGNLQLKNLSINGAGIKAVNFISSDSNGSSNHYNLSISHCTIQNLDKENGCRNLFYAYKYMVADSIVIRNTSILNNTSDGIMMPEEKDNRGYYNAEKIVITQNDFNKQTGMLVDIYRGGSDESTMGPLLLFTDNKISACMNKTVGMPLVRLYGVQRSFIENNDFRDSNKGSVLISYEDVVRATHLFANNKVTGSGQIITNKFVQAQGNIIQ
jgi:poly(beta-D-mannuronate) lyase